MFLYPLISAHILCYYSNNKCEELLPYPVKKYLNRKISYFFSFIPKKHYTFASQLRQYTYLTCLGCKMVITIGEMVEWSITTVLKTVVLRGTGGSNPSLSALGTLNRPTEKS